MARTKEDVASKGDSSPKIPKSAAGVTKNTAEPPVKRGRGGKKKAAPTPKKVAAVNDDGTPKRGRGRPRRGAAIAEDEEPTATTPKEPKKRGRKPKTASPADASADDDKDDDAADDVSDKEASAADLSDKDEEEDGEE
ncbi:hypothetical protein FLAG1_03857 [Fusarium langsethiae]|uniref:Uncharacterized protein n=1 Tax=Fusarium langsethiae TaxID=179993 RepID=A0A0M9F0H7_FUSLA|nr:hypothetical protein FLAG1_03857 [Fusarium langsethiae]GKU01751.1 unnamed protein product [Fusarium langsethiae]